MEDYYKYSLYVVAILVIGWVLVSMYKNETFLTAMPTPPGMREQMEKVARVGTNIYPRPLDKF